MTEEQAKEIMMRYLERLGEQLLACRRAWHDWHDKHQHGIS